MNSKNEFIWKIDHSYKNTGSKRNKEDEFIRKLWVDKEEDGDWTIQNQSGIRGLAIGIGGKKNSNSINKSAIVIITTSHSTGSYNPWEDTIDNFNGIIKYWGDAKHKKNYDIDDFNGNRLLVNIDNKRLEGNFAEIPPILYFINTPGQMEFKGLCVLEGVEKRWFMDKDRRIKNYRFTFGIMDVNYVNPDWIKHRAKHNSDKHNYCPSEWKNYVSNGTYSRLQTWKKKIKTKEEQMPSENSKEARFLNRLKEMPYHDFETVIVNMLRKNKITHSITQTRKTRDGGLDMEGHFELPSPLSYEIFFKGEVKRHENSIGPGKVSRLVARLKRGEYGLFFTTSYYTLQAQKEVLEDGYPVKLFSGIDMYKLFDNANMINNGKLEK